MNWLFMIPIVVLVSLAFVALVISFNLMPGLNRTCLALAALATLFAAVWWKGPMPYAMLAGWGTVFNLVLIAGLVGLVRLVEGPTLGRPTAFDRSL